MKTQNQSYTRIFNVATAGDIGFAGMVDLVARRWRTIVGAAALAMLLGFGAVAVRDSHFNYSSTVQIGGPTGPDGVRPIIEPAKLAGMLNVGYLIQSADFMEKFPISSSLNVTASALGTSPLLRLEAKGKLGDEAAIIEYLAAINGLITQECARLIDLGQRQDLAAKQIALTQKIEHVRNGISRDEQNLVRIAELIRAYQVQLVDAKAALDSIIGGRGAKVSGADANVQALAMLLSGNELQHAQEIYFKIDEQLNDKLPRQREEIKSAISRAQLELGALDAEVQKTQSQLTNLRETRAQIPPMRPTQPINSRMDLILILSLIGGALLGLVAALVTDLRANYLKAHSRAFNSTPTPL